MKGITEKRINEISKTFSQDELRVIFGARLDDELFISVGVMETPIAVQRHIQPHLLAWRGYEILTNSPYGK